MREHREEGVDGVAPVDAQNASTSRLENPHRTRVSHTAHAQHFWTEEENQDNDVSRTRLALRPGISNSLTGQLREDLSEGLRNYVSANTLEQELNALRQQRSLLELTQVQREAIVNLVRRPLTPGEIFRSTDFWLGRVLPGAVFFWLGLLTRGLFR